MSIYSRIFAATSKRLTSAAARGQRIPPEAFWAFPGLVGASWFMWGALTDDIKQSVGLYYDPDIVLKRVEAEREARLEAKEQLKAAASGGSKTEEEDEEAEEDEEEEVTAKDIEEAVNKAVEAAEGADDEEEDAPDADADAGADADADGAEEDEEEEEEEEEAPKKPKVDFNSLSTEQKWDYFAERAVIPGDDDDDVSTYILYLNTA
jgi:hypothetical protein